MKAFRNLIILILLSCAGVVQAQRLKMIEFRADLSMTDAVKFPKEDLNGDRCGLIRLGLVLPDATFEGDIISSEYKNREWWIYMVKGANWLTILSDDYLPLRCEFSDYNIKGIQSNVTYIMTVEKPSGPEPVTEQYLMFQITPHNALLEVNDQVWPVSQEGTARKLVDFGTYSYRIQAENYYTEEGVVEVDNSKETQVVKKDLKPNFGWIEVAGNGNLKDANVFVDNAYIGKAPCKSEAIKSGKHVVRIVKEMFAVHAETVTVKDNESFSLSPELAADFAHLTLEVDADAEIWVNDEKKGVRTWSGDLPSGTYRVECKQSNHETTSTKLEVTSEMNGQTIPLVSPKPFKGSLAVESTPDMADLYIDNEYVGKTPRLVNEIVAGQHELRLTKEGYKEYTGTVIVKRNERTQMEPKLEALPQPKPKKLEKPKRPKPVSNNSIKITSDKSVFFATANFAYSLAPQASFGFSVGQVKRLGWFVSAMSNFGFKAMQYHYTADADGYVDGEYPYYLGESCSTRISVLGGVIYKVVEPLYLRAGLGYGQRVKSWYISDGRLAKMSDDSWTGVDVSLGAQLHLKGFVLSLDAVTTSFKDMEVKAGVGYAF